MKIELVQELLTAISELDRSPFSDSAALTWAEALRGIDYADARQAVLEHYGSLGARDGGGQVRRVIPADIRTRARAIKEARERAAQRALPPGPRGRVGSTGRPPAVLAALADARASAQRAVRKHEAAKVA